MLSNKYIDGMVRYLSILGWQPVFGFGNWTISSGIQSSLVHTPNACTCVQLIPFPRVLIGQQIQSVRSNTLSDAGALIFPILSSLHSAPNASLIGFLPSISVCIPIYAMDEYTATREKHFHQSLSLWCLCVCVCVCVYVYIWLIAVMKGKGYILSLSPIEPFSKWAKRDWMFVYDRDPL